MITSAALECVVLVYLVWSGKLLLKNIPVLSCTVWTHLLSSGGAPSKQLPFAFGWNPVKIINIQMGCIRPEIRI